MVLARHFFDLFCLVECCSNYWIPNNITKLNHRLESQFIGQPLAYKLILNSISSHVRNSNPSKALVLSLHGSTGTGKNFVAKHLVESLYREGFKSKYVKFYVVSRDFMHDDQEHIRNYKDRLTKEIEEVTSLCEQTMFIFDEIDQMPYQLLEAITFYLDFHEPTNERSIDFRKAIFIFLSNAGGQQIINLTEKYHRLSLQRENYPILEFQQLLSNVSFHEKGGLQHTSLIDKHLITFHIPFLPLERSHIRHCIRQQLDHLLENEQYIYEYSENEISKQILNLIEFSSSDKYEYSLSGCKRVQQKLNFIFESLKFKFKHEMTAKQQQIESLNSEIQILQNKLDSKTKAFAILINELETFKHERDQFKNLADSLQEKLVQLKKQFYQTHKSFDPLKTLQSSQGIYEHPNDSTIHLLKTALKNVQDEKEILQNKVDELTHELNDVKGDLMIFRQKRHRARINTNQIINTETNQTTKDISNEETNLLLNRLEQANERITELDNDLKLIVCQKEELEIERDSFKTKYSKLNHQLNKMLNGNEKHIIDIELVLSENRYLKEKVNDLIQEKNLAVANAMKYKELLQTHRSASNHLGKVHSSGDVLTHKQVQNLLKQSYLVPGTPDIENDLRSIAEALFESVKDKNVTINHQRKTNKILANRVAELENLLAESSLTSKSNQTNTLIHLLDRTPTPPLLDNAASQFINSLDEQQQQTSPTQIFTFSSTWPTSPPLSTRISEDDSNLKTKGIKYQTPVLMKNTLECHQSRNLRKKSESIELEMDDPLQSPTLTTSIAYLEEQDLIPPKNREQFHNLVNHATTSLTDKSTEQISNTSAANLTC